MEFLIAIYITVTLLLCIKLLARAIRAKFVIKDFADSTWWAVVGTLITFNVVVVLMSLVGGYIHLIVKATL